MGLNSGILGYICPDVPDHKIAFPVLSLSQGHLFIIALSLIHILYHVSSVLKSVKN